MNESVSFLLKHRSQGALLDANLLLVYVVGKTGASRLANLHHTKQYQRDFPLIERMVEVFPTIYTTPNVLTEVSNLGKKLGVEFYSLHWGGSLRFWTSGIAPVKMLPQ